MDPCFVDFVLYFGLMKRSFRCGSQAFVAAAVETGKPQAGTLLTLVTQQPKKLKINITLFRDLHFAFEIRIIWLDYYCQ